MENGFIPKVLLDSGQWNLTNFTLYENSPFLPALIQVIHRWNGYFLYLMGVIFYFNILRSDPQLKIWGLGFMSILNFQVFLGIYTLINSVGIIPLAPASLHQLFGIILLIWICFLIFKTKEYSVR
jgi:cytochrome c oxidase assembly protein subunit 15